MFATPTHTTQTRARMNFEDFASWQLTASADSDSIETPTLVMDIVLRCLNLKDMLRLCRARSSRTKHNHTRARPWTRGVWERYHDRCIFELVTYFQEGCSPQDNPYWSPRLTYLLDMPRKCQRERKLLFAKRRFDLL
jgi:hypothetical protein